MQTQIRTHILLCTKMYHTFFDEWLLFYFSNISIPYIGRLESDDDEKAVTFGQAVRSWTNRCWWVLIKAAQKEQTLNGEMFSR